MRPVVLDTNVVLDLLVFADPRTADLREALAARSLRWLATAAMRDELAHVLAYPQFVRRVSDASPVLALFDAQVQMVQAAPAAPAVCRDPDDQKFIDLAVAHRSLLVSKDHAVLKLKRKLALLDVQACAVYAKNAFSAAAVS